MAHHSNATPSPVDCDGSAPGIPRQEYRRRGGRRQRRYDGGMSRHRELKTLQTDMRSCTRCLDVLVGQALDLGKRIVLPFPHPSGANLWLNRPESQALLRRTLNLLRDMREGESL